LLRLTRTCRNDRTLDWSIKRAWISTVRLTNIWNEADITSLPWCACQLCLHPTHCDREVHWPWENDEKMLWRTTSVLEQCGCTVNNWHRTLALALWCSALDHTTAIAWCTSNEYILQRCPHFPTAPG
jgi:hypothetical protein